jgi:NAD(P)-dependent dehydrogenase (short-subunit alcohol dehydrogenase family)
MNTNRVVLITGAAGGVGSVLVERFLANGDTIIATDAREDTLTSWRQRFDADAKLSIIAADVSSDDDVAKVAQFAASTAGRVDVLINAAGYFPFTRFEDMPSAQFRKIIEINLTGTFLMAQAVLPLMKNSSAGRIINYGSGSVFDGTAGQSHYVAAKAGIIGFSRSLAREVGGYNITVNVITPGLTVTKAVRDSFPASILQAQRDARAIQRDEVPEDLVGPTFFLASNDAAFVTGQILNVDGGAAMV